MRLREHLPVIGHADAAVPSRAEPDEGELNYAAILTADARYTDGSAGV